MPFGAWPLRLLASQQAPLLAAGLTLLAPIVAITLTRGWHRRERHYVRLRVIPYRGDDASAEGIVAMFEALHKRLLRRWWRRLLFGQPSISLEVHHAQQAWLAICCPEGSQQMVLSALRAAYPNCRLEPQNACVGRPPVLLRLKKEQLFIKRAKAIDRFEHEREPFMNRLLQTLAGSAGPAYVQVAMTPAHPGFERHAKRLYKRHEHHISRARGAGLLEPRLDRSMVEDAELRGGLEIQHRPLFFADIRVIADRRSTCEQVASALRAEVAENRLVERGTALRQGLFGIYSGRVARGEGNPLPAARKGVFSSTEMAAMWHLPSLDFLAAPIHRSSLPVAPAPAGILRSKKGIGTLLDQRGTVSIHPAMRRQNTAVIGTVEQGKSSYLVASIVEDLLRSSCAVILLDPKGDAADAALSSIPVDRTCTLLDFAHPTCGFNPLAVNGPADVIADYVVAALRNLFTDADIRASSDRYLRNAIIAVLAYDRKSTLWDAARLLSVGPEGYAYRAHVGSRVRELPELKEIADFFTAELSAQLTDARSATTAKLDAPVNKLARLLNSPSIKRVLLNQSLRVDFEQLIQAEEVLIVKGALGGMGAGNTAVLMQLLVGMLDAALSRQQDLAAAQDRVTVALKVDEAPMVLNRGFAETMALKRSAGLETVACWQTNAQWVDREVRDQLDALFAHRVYFATASVQDARQSASLLMAQFSDAVRPRIGGLSALGHPDARLHLPKHHAIASWSTPAGRALPFVGQTLALKVDPEMLCWHAARQRERGGRYLSDLSTRPWDRDDGERQPIALPAQQRRRRVAGNDTTGPRRGHDGPAPSGSQPGRDATSGERPPSASLAPLPEATAVGFGELVSLDRSHRMRRVPLAPKPRQIKADPRDLQLLVSIATFRHLLSSQLHRRHGGGAALTGTQRRLKRLADAGLIERLQFHASDGGGVPMCCRMASAGLELLAASAQDCDAVSARDRSGVGEREISPAAIRRDLHAAGWALALERVLNRGLLNWSGAACSVISPPLVSGVEGARAIGPAHLRLPGGRVPHRFVRMEVGGALTEVDRFETLRPALRVVLVARKGETIAAATTSSFELLVEMDDRWRTAGWWTKVARYDHFLTGWSLHLRRHGRDGVLPSVVFVCRDRSRARDCARAADRLLLASRAYAGEDPGQWLYSGRDQIVFCAERDMHEGLLGAYAVPNLPPHLDTRSSAARSVPRAANLITRSIDTLIGEKTAQEST